RPARFRRQTPARQTRLARVRPLPRDGRSDAGESLISIRRVGACAGPQNCFRNRCGPPQAATLQKTFSMRISLTIFATLLSTSRAFAPSYTVRDFGATGDGTTKDTKAFQKALDTCAVNGGGDVLVPAGKYLIGSIQIGNRTILRLAQD